MTNRFKIALIMQGGRDWIGGSEYTKNLVLALGSLPEDVRETFEIHLISREPLNPDYKALVAPYVTDFYDEAQGLPSPTPLNAVRWNLLKLLFRNPNPRFEDIIRRQRIDFVYPWAGLSLGRGYRAAAWIPDFQHKYLAEYFTDKEIKQRDRYYSRIARICKTVVLSSKTAAEDFKKFFPFAAQKATVLSFKTKASLPWYEGDPEAVRQKYHLAHRFFIISNQFWQHKNHLIVLEALKILKSKQINPVIVCTGHIHDHRNPSYSDKILSLIHCYGLAQQVLLLGLIPRQDQIQLIRKSIAVIQPSLFEGWSTVVEDGRVLGKKIILSDLPVNIEQDPPHGLFFDQTSPEELARIMESVYADNSPRPDIEAEKQALENNRKSVEDYGYCFLKMAGCLPRD